MSIEPSSESSSLLSNEQSDGSSTNTLSLFEDSIFKDAHDAFEEHLDKDPVEQNILDRCLMSGLKIVQKQERELSQVAPTLQLLLKHGAKWMNDALLENGMTPYHLICKTNGDHHELLDLLLVASKQGLIDKEDHSDCTALVYAIWEANINCVRSLLKSGANVNKYSVISNNWWGWLRSPLVEAMNRLPLDTEHSTIIKAEIFDLLLSSGADVNAPCSKHTPPPVLYAFHCGNVECIKKLLQKGARLGRTSYQRNYIWAEIVKKGNVEVLKSVIEHGIDKDSTDESGVSMLRLVIESGDAEAVSYLLDLGVTLTKYQPEEELIPCKKCGTNRLHLGSDGEQAMLDPCIAAISRNSPDLCQLLERHGVQGFNSFNVLRKAINCPDGMEYLLNKYTYSLNIEYTTYDTKTYHSYYRTILMEACYSNNVHAVKMSLDHGADPNKRMCEKKCFSAINIAIHQCGVGIVAHLIRSGLDINSHSYHYVHGYVLPFEAAVLDDRLNAAKMFLVSGCSCGVYSLNSNHKFKVNIKSDLKNLMKKWNVGSNNVNPLRQQCRRVILKHLSPQTHKKILVLPLPESIIKYLSIPELDDIVKDDIIHSPLWYILD